MSEKDAKSAKTVAHTGPIGDSQLVLTVLTAMEENNVSTRTKNVSIYTRYCNNYANDALGIII